MKYLIKSALILSFFLTGTVNVNSQSHGPKISLTVTNIPKIQQKVTRKLSDTFTSSYTDKSPTITYRLKNDFENRPVAIKANQKRVHKVFDEDIIYLKLRYNPGKSKLFILKRGDEAFIEYAEGKPYLDIKNRVLKEHDENISELLPELGIPVQSMIFYFKNRRGRTPKEKRAAVKAYDKALSFLDSLSQNDLLSPSVYEYYRKKTIYERELQLEKFTIAYLTAPDLHVKGFDLFMRQYVFGNLKKKIISLGNGMARNSLEAFDFVYASDDFSEKNKQHLLFNSLKGIKKDFSNATYNKRYQQYQSLISETDNNLTKTNTPKTPSVYTTSKAVLLGDSKDNTTTLQDLLDKHKGKVIYLDFWASWCAPCRKAFPSYASLQKEYADKGVVFIFISGDEDANKWKKANLKEGLTNSYRALNYPDAMFYKKLNLRSFPRYMIFDTSGKLARDTAPGPSSDNIRALINELLKE